MTIQPNYVNEELLHEFSESFRLNSQIPPELYSRYRIKRGLRNADGTGVLVGASRLGNVHGYIINEGEVLARGSAEEIISNESVRKIYLGENFRM